MEGLPVPGIKVTNLKNGQHIYSETGGIFTISARAGDSIQFDRHNLETKTVVLTREMLRHNTVITMVKSAVKLEEVVLEAEYTPIELDVVTYNRDLLQDIKEDIKKHPYKYAKMQTGVNIFALLGTVVKLIAPAKPPSPKTVYVSADDLDALFEESAFFSKQMLERDLKIPADQQYLFFTFCEIQHLDTDLLKEENQFLLLDKLLYCLDKFQNKQENTD
ncbi:hypothetical protein DMZ48_18030 [Robertkochia solimangrovi]|nr:hypothetical protein DMZ48_18030 [Robertkochia solimangrovi]